MQRRNFVLLAGGIVLAAKPVRAQGRVHSEEPVQVEADLGSVRERYTTVDQFYIRNHGSIPSPSSRSVLRIEGDVASPVRLSFADLSRLNRLKLGAVLECAGNPVSAASLVSNGEWDGWLLRDVLELSRPSARSGFVHLFGRDGYARSVSMEQVRDGAMLAVSLNGRPLASDHGAPWRAFFPGWYGMDSVKWLERVVVSAMPLPNNKDTYVEIRPAEAVGVVRRPLPRIQVKSIITSPAAAAVVHRGIVEVRGLAWSGQGGIQAVQVSPDGGANWERTDIAAAGRYEWVLWQALVALRAPGTTQLVCRATDTSGHRQPEQRSTDRLDGYGQNFYHRVEISVM